MIKRPRGRFLTSLTLSIMLMLMITFSDGCAHTKGSTAPPTPYQNVLAANAVLAESNKDIAKAVIAERDARLIPAPAAHDILAVQYRVAKLDERLSKILANGPDAAKLKGDAIKSILSEIQLLGNDPALAMSNSAQSKMAAIVNLTNTLLIGLHEAGVL